MLVKELLYYITCTYVVSLFKSFYKQDDAKSC
jgi:hypothetical protein